MFIQHSQVIYLQARWTSYAVNLTSLVHQHQHQHMKGNPLHEDGGSIITLQGR